MWTGLHGCPFSFQGQSCETCGIRMHLPCVAKYFQSNSEPRCPNCNDYWPHEIPGWCPCGSWALLAWGRGSGRWGACGVCISRAGAPHAEGSVVSGAAWCARSESPRHMGPGLDGALSQQLPRVVHVSPGSLPILTGGWRVSSGHCKDRVPGTSRVAGNVAVVRCNQPCHSVSARCSLCVEVFDPEKERGAGLSKPSRKSLRPRQH